MYNLNDYATYVSQIAGKQGFWMAVDTTQNKFARIALADFAKVGFLLQVDPRTTKGIQAINTEIFKRLVK